MGTGRTALPGRYAAISAGYDLTCALTDAGEAVCLGRRNEYGQLDAPPGRYTAISASENRSCAVTEAGAIVCWGDTEYTDFPLRY